MAGAHLRKADALKVGVKTDPNNLSLSKAEYEAAIKIFKQLSDKDPGNANRLIPLAGAYKLYGDVLLGSGDKQGALAQYGNELDIRQKLANKDKTRSSWQTSADKTQKKVNELRAELAADSAGAKP